MGKLIPLLSIFSFLSFLSPSLTYTFERSAEPFTNPLIGYAPSLHDVNELNPDSKLIYLQILWKDLEPEEGVYDWEWLEESNHLAVLREKGIHLVLRFICDYPGVTAHIDIPQWLYEKTDGSGTHYNNVYGHGFSPDYSNPTMIEAHARTIAELGKHFQGDTLVSYIELGVLGHWGEWHTRQASGISYLPEADIREQYIQPWVDAFPQSRILMRRPFTHAKDHGFGLYNDMTGIAQDTLQWLYWIENGDDSYQNEPGAVVPMPDAWKSAPIGGEFGNGNESEMFRNNLEETLSLITRSHMSFIGPHIPSIRYPIAYTRILNTLGYRITLTKLDIQEVSEGTKFTLYWENNGSAPMYWDWPVRLYLMNEMDEEIFYVYIDIHLSELIPGEALKSTNIIENKGVIDLLKQGGKLSLGIEDPMTGKDSVRLANNVPYQNGRNLLVQ